MITFSNVTKIYNNEVKALDDVSFSVHKGEIVGFIGPNGSGKTTSMKLMTGVLPVEEGNIEVAGYNVSTQPIQAKQHIGYIADNPDQFVRLTGREYLDFIADIYGVTPKEQEERMVSFARRFGMEEALDKQMVSYSHGMRQKMMVIGALIHQPDVWILDEPLTGLDPQSAFILKQMMREHADKGNAVIFSTHVLEVAEKLCDRVLIIRYGHLLYDGTLEELQKKHKESTLEEIFLEMMKDESV